MHKFLACIVIVFGLCLESMAQTHPTVYWVQLSSIVPLDAVEAKEALTIIRNQEQDSVSSYSAKDYSFSIGSRHPIDAPSIIEALNNTGFYCADITYGPSPTVSLNVKTTVAYQTALYFSQHPTASDTLIPAIKVTYDEWMALTEEQRAVVGTHPQFHIVD